MSNKITHTTIYTLFDYDLDVIIAGTKNILTEFINNKIDTFTVTSSDTNANTFTPLTTALFSILAGLNITTPANALQKRLNANYKRFAKLLTQSGLFKKNNNTDVAGLYVISFNQLMFGDSIACNSLLDFEFKYNSVTLKIDVDTKVTNINPSIDSNHTRYIKNSTTEVGVLYGSLGIMVLYHDIANVSPQLTNSSNGYLQSKALVNDNFNTGTLNFLVKGNTLLKSNYYICRVKNKQYNYSNNSTFLNKNTGVILIEDMQKEGPTVYITGIGLYNLNNLLVAIAKPSQPIKKTFFNLATIQIRLDY